MTTRLAFSNKLSLPLESVTQTFAILARKRVGKTYTASVIAEEMIEAGLPFVVLDPTGAWWGLRALADGKSAGYPVIIIGGTHGDIPLESTAGKVIAELVVDHPGHYIIDLSATESDAEQDRFATDFAARLYRYKEQHRFPMHLFIDEADSFAPQRPFENQKRMLGAFEAIVRRGGIRGIGVTFITQRPAVLNKNVLTQTECLIVLQMSAPQDQDAIDSWVSRNGTPEQRDTMMGSLASLKQGEAWVWSPSWLECFQRVHVRARKTFNSSATPKVGEKAILPQRLAAVDLDSIRAKVAATIENAKANDPELLKREVAELKRQLKTRPETKAEKVVERVEVPVLGKAEAQRLVKQAEELMGDINVAQRTIPELLKVFSTTAQTLLTGLKALEAKGVAADTPRAPVLRPYLPTPNKPASVAPVTKTLASSSLVRGQREILDTLARCHPMRLTLSQISKLSKRSIKSSSFQQYERELRSNGLVEKGTDDRYTLTQAGMAVIGFTPGQALTVAELTDLWRNALVGTQRAMFDYVISAHGHWVDIKEISAAVGRSLTSSSFDQYLRDLKANGVIDRQGDQVRATDMFKE